MQWENRIIMCNIISKTYNISEKVNVSPSSISPSTVSPSHVSQSEVSPSHVSPSPISPTAASLSVKVNQP